MDKEGVRFLEELAANAWPAGMVQMLDGWRLRFSWGVSRRANSVWPNEDGGRYALADKLALVEAFYRRHNLPARFQICPAASPAGLDILLEQRGYVLDAPTFVQTAPLQAVPSALDVAADVAIDVDGELSPAWFEPYQALAGIDDVGARIRQTLLARVPLPMAFTRAWRGDEVVGVGLGVWERGHLGIFSMVTRPDTRRQGVATAVLAALARWGLQRQAATAYLQVMEVNAPARRLYARAGFETAYQYTYRQQPVAD